MNRAQNYTPIQAINAKTPMEKVSALMSNGNIPIGKMLARPIIANNMDKIISAVAKDLIVPLISNGTLNDMISSMSKQFSNSKDTDSSNSNDNMDISSLMETFMPLISNIMSDSSSNTESDTKKEEINLSSSNQNDIKKESNLSNNIIEPTINANKLVTEENSKNPSKINSRIRRKKYY